MSEVRSLIDAIAHRLPGKTNLYPALNTAILRIAKRLFYHGSDMITGSLDIDIDEDDSSGALPSGFGGLMGKPYIEDMTWPLEPLPSKEVALIYPSTGIPQYYQIKNLTLHIIPGTSSDITILGDYFAIPTTLTAPGDTVPFGGLFDDAIQEFLIQWYGEGSKGDPNNLVMLATFINEVVDSIVPKRDKTAAPKNPSGGINWGGMTDDI